jgi:heptosyltransferase-2
MVMAQSLFKDIKARYPNVLIDVLAPAWTAAIVDRMPEVNQLIATDFSHGKLSLASRRAMGKRLRTSNYQRAIVLPNSYKAALVPWLAKIPIRSGFVGEQRWGVVNDIRKLDKSQLPMTVQRFIALGREQGAEPVALSQIAAPKLDADLANADILLSNLDLNQDRKILALCPGAEFGPSKQWPIENYAEVANKFIADGWQVWLFGSDKDIATCKQIRDSSPENSFVLAGKTSLPDAVDLLALADLVVSNDSGLMHIAASLQRPLVAVYGSTDPGHTPPLSPNHKIERLGLECSPCFERQCPLGHLHCLTELSAGRVIQASASLLSDPTSLD